MNDNERLNHIIKSKKLNKSTFAKEIGIPGPQILYDVSNGKNGISKNLAQKISEKYSEYSYSWILTGEGSMYNVPKEELNEKEILLRAIDRTSRTLEKLTNYLIENHPLSEDEKGEWVKQIYTNEDAAHSA